MSIQVSELGISDVATLRAKAEYLGLDDNKLFSIYSTEQMAEVYNGVGPDRFSWRFRNFLSELNRTILPAVLIHDLDYDFGGTWADFYAANRRLGRNARKCVRAKYSRKSLKYWVYLAKIALFVILCNKRGKPGWNFRGTDNA